MCTSYVLPLHQVKGLLTQNIEKVIQRGERLDQLEDRAGKEQARVVSGENVGVAKRCEMAPECGTLGGNER